MGADGRVVRHLAAGVLGVTNTASPLVPGLAQSLDWDGRDDSGEFPAGSFSARIRLGTRARFGAVLFHESGIAFCPRAATVGPDGLVYVLQEHGQAKSTFLLEAYTRDGKYVRTVMPYPSGLADERLAGLPRARFADGRVRPAIHHGAFRDLYPDSTGMRPQSMPVTSKGEILLVNAARTHNAGVRLVQRVLCVGTDGGIPRSNYLGPLTSAEKHPYGLTWLALSPDEKWIYTSGQLKDGNYDDGYGTPPHHVVYRLAWEDEGPAKPFIGELNTPGDDQSHFNAPRGIATDAAGRIYVCDWGNNRVAVFDDNGKWVGKSDIEAPDQVALNRKTGTFYVLTNRQIGKNQSESRILRFDSIGKPPSAEVNVGFPYCTMTIDTSSERPVLWLARTFGEAAQAKRGVERVIDEGDRLSAPVEVISHRSITDPCQIAASMVTDDVFVHGYSDHVFARVDGITGEVKTFPKIRGHDVGVGPKGELAVLEMTSYSPSLASITLYNRDGDPIPSIAGACTSFKGVPGNKWGHGLTGSKGFSISPRGDLLVIGSTNETYGVWVFGPDGTFRENVSVRGLSGADGSPAMDREGNIYVASAAKLESQFVPLQFGTPKPPTPWYDWIYGSVIKFGPGGGTVIFKSPDARQGSWPPEDSENMMKLVSNMRGRDVLAGGTRWSAGGLTVTPASNWSVGACGCYTSRFGIDYFGRVFVPDVGQFAVRVIDAAGNPILSFGDYGNADSGRRNSSVNEPDIPLAWPVAVSPGRSGVYVSDFINRRILRVHLVPTVEQTVALP
jgi:hypothetical protein